MNSTHIHFVAHKVFQSQSHSHHNAFFHWMTINHHEVQNPRIRYNFKIPDLILLPSPKFLPICVTCSSRRDCTHMQKTDFNIRTCPSNNVGFNPFVCLGRICCSKESENFSNSKLQDRIFQQGFLLQFYCHVWCELFCWHVCWLPHCHKFHCNDCWEGNL